MVTKNLTVKRKTLILLLYRILLLRLTLVKNIINDGDIFIFDRNGKGLRKFNRKGQGSEEYIFNLSAFVDDNSGEIYIDEIIRNVLVYDFQGNFLKSIPRGDNKWINATNYNQDYLIARESPSIQIQNKTDYQRFVIISKQDGNIAKDFRIYFKKKVEWGITNRAEKQGVPLVFILSFLTMIVGC